MIEYRMMVLQFFLLDWLSIKAQFLNIDALLAQLVMLIFYFAGNGMIDFNEFVVMMQKKKSSMTREGELREAFRMFDKVECKKYLLNL